MPAEPLLLPLGALGFYLFDSLLMLYGNEVLLLGTGRDAWRCAAGGEWLLAGRRMLLPNPFTPWQPAWRLVRLAAGTETAARTDPALLQAMRSALRPLGVLVLLLQWLMLPGLAFELALLGSGGWLLLLLAAIYALLLLAGATLLLRRERLRLSRAVAWSLALEGLLCPPFAINLVRKVALRQRLTDDPLALAERLCNAAAVAALRAQLRRDEGQV